MATTYDDKGAESSDYDEKNASPHTTAVPADEVGYASGVHHRNGFSWRVYQEPSSFAKGASSNADLDPIPQSKRVWGAGAFVAYWMADAWAVSNWEVASSMISVGLTWKMAIGACVLGNTIMGLVITCNGRIGAITHAPFPILIRGSFGYYFSYFAVISRCVLAIVWLGVQTTTGGQCMEVLLNAIFPSYKHIPNHISPSQGITTGGMVAFLLYFLLQIPFLCIPYTKVQYFFGLKSIIAPVIFLAVFGSTLHKAGGTIAHSDVITGVGLTKVQGSALVWAFFGNLNGVLGNYATLGLNIADFARYSKKPNSQNVQALIIPCIFTIVGLLGIFTAAASQSAYGQVLWNPITIIGLWSESGSHSGRAASAFGAIGLLIVTLGINISANSISAANDLMALCPKYINIRRGQLLAAVIGSWAFVPWKILESAAKFLSFLGGYTIFLGPMTAIMMTDYYIVHTGKISVIGLYNFDGIYKYNKFGTNWRALAAFLIGMVPALPGFINNIQDTIDVSEGGQHLFAIGYIYSFVAAGLFYWIFNKVSPAHETILTEAETHEEFEARADQDRRMSVASMRSK